MTPARFMLLGGEPMDRSRYISWNFVDSSKDRIEQAKADWKADRFQPMPNDDEFIPHRIGEPLTSTSPRRSAPALWSYVRRGRRFAVHPQPGHATGIQSVLRFRP